MNSSFNKLFLAGLIAASVPLGYAEEVSSSLDQRIAILERKLEISEEEAAAKAKTGTKVQLGDGGLVVSSNDGNFKVKFGGYFQGDYRAYFKDRSISSPAPNTFLIRRARLSLDATINKDFAIRILPSWDSGSAALQDAYGEFKRVPEIGVRVGKFKTPIDIERLQSDVNYLFAETALTSNLTPNRDVGAQLQGDIGSGLLTYAAGVYNGVADGAIADTDTTSDKDLAARIFVKPFKNYVNVVQGLGVGLATSYGKRWGTSSSTQLPSFKTDGQQTFFSYTTASTSTGTTVADGIVLRVVPQLYYSRNSLGILAQYVTSTQELRRANTRRRFDNIAWQTALTYVLTGEDATLNGIVPRKPFNVKEKQWGAWEIAVRYADLQVDKDIFKYSYASNSTSAERARAYTAGLSWYLSKFTRAYVDYSQTRFTRGATRGDRENENFLVTRLQFVF